MTSQQPYELRHRIGILKTGNLKLVIWTEVKKRYFDWQHDLFQLDNDRYHRKLLQEVNLGDANTQCVKLFNTLQSAMVALSKRI